MENKNTLTIVFKNYDDEILDEVTLDLTDEELNNYMELCEEMNITFEEFIEKAIREYINDFDLNDVE